MKIITNTLVAIALLTSTITNLEARPHNGYAKKKHVIVKPRHHYKKYRHHRHGWHGYAAGAIITGIVIGAVVASAETIEPSRVHEIKGADGITYYFVDGKKCILIDGHFKQVS